jgi:hypothetical protein
MNKTPMTKKHFIALADTIKEHNRVANDFNKGSELEHYPAFSQEHIERLAGFCLDQNPHFNQTRWKDYIAGKCRSNGGKQGACIITAGMSEEATEDCTMHRHEKP